MKPSPPRFRSFAPIPAAPSPAPCRRFRRRQRGGVRAPRARPVRRPAGWHAAGRHGAPRWGKSPRKKVLPRRRPTRRPSSPATSSRWAATRARPDASGRSSSSTGTCACAATFSTSCTSTRPIIGDRRTGQRAHAPAPPSRPLECPVEMAPLQLQEPGSGEPAAAAQAHRQRHRSGARDRPDGRPRQHHHGLDARSLVNLRGRASAPDWRRLGALSNSQDSARDRRQQRPHQHAGQVGLGRGGQRVRLAPLRPDALAFRPRHRLQQRHLPGLRGRHHRRSRPGPRPSSTATRSALSWDFGAQGHHVGLTDLGSGPKRPAPGPLAEGRRPPADVDHHPARRRAPVPGAGPPGRADVQLRHSRWCTASRARSSTTTDQRPGAPAAAASPGPRARTWPPAEHRDVNALVFLPSLWMKLAWKALPSRRRPRAWWARSTTPGPLVDPWRRGRKLTLQQLGWVVATELRLYQQRLLHRVRDRWRHGRPGRGPHHLPQPPLEVRHPAARRQHDHRLQVLTRLPRRRDPLPANLSARSPTRST